MNLDLLNLLNSLNTLTWRRCLASHHQSLVHEELLPWGSIVVLGVDGEAEEEDIHHNLEDGQEAVSHQEGE